MTGGGLPSRGVRAGAAGLVFVVAAACSSGSNDAPAVKPAGSGAALTACADFAAMYVPLTTSDPSDDLDRAAWDENTVEGLRAAGDAYDADPDRYGRLSRAWGSFAVATDDQAAMRGVFDACRALPGGDLGVSGGG